MLKQMKKTKLWSERYTKIDRDSLRFFTRIGDVEQNKASRVITAREMRDVQTHELRIVTLHDTYSLFSDFDDPSGLQQFMIVRPLQLPPRSGAGGGEACIQSGSHNAAQRRVQMPKKSTQKRSHSQRGKAALLLCAVSPHHRPNSFERRVRFF